MTVFLASAEMVIGEAKAPVITKSFTNKQQSESIEGEVSKPFRHHINDNDIDCAAYAGHLPLSRRRFFTLPDLSHGSLALNE